MDDRTNIDPAIKLKLAIGSINGIAAMAELDGCLDKAIL